MSYRLGEIADVKAGDHFVGGIRRCQIVRTPHGARIIINTMKDPADTGQDAICAAFEAGEQINLRIYTGGKDDKYSDRFEMICRVDSITTRMAGKELQADIFLLTTDALCVAQYEGA